MLKYSNLQKKKKSFVKSRCITIRIFVQLCYVHMQQLAHGDKMLNNTVETKGMLIEWLMSFVNEGGIPRTCMRC